jgi:hypothetical protein
MGPMEFQVHFGTENAIDHPADLLVLASSEVGVLDWRGVSRVSSQGSPHDGLMQAGNMSRTQRSCQAGEPPPLDGCP